MHKRLVTTQLLRDLRGERETYPSRFAGACHAAQEAGMSIAAIARNAGVGRPAVYRALARSRGAGAADDPQIARYIDWAGEDVYVEITIDGIVIGETEQGGTYSREEAIETLRHIDAPEQIIEWVLGVTR